MTVRRWGEEQEEEEEEAEGKNETVHYTRPAGVSQGPMSGADAAAGKDGQLVLHFSDERRRRLACKILVQAKHHIAQRASDGVETFLKGIKSGGQL
eukprot:5208698-Pyramimonas_sp.AAC.1